MNRIKLLVILIFSVSYVSAQSHLVSIKMKTDLARAYKVLHDESVSGGPNAINPLFQYYVIIGSFRHHQNALRLRNNVGVTNAVVLYKGNRYIRVSVGGANSLTDVADMLKQARLNFDKNAWVLKLKEYE
jgi:hypothetical protein